MKWPHKASDKKLILWLLHTLSVYLFLLIIILFLYYFYNCLKTGLSNYLGFDNSRERPTDRQTNRQSRDRKNDKQTDMQAKGQTAR